MLRVDRLGALEAPAVDVADEGGVLVVGAEILDGGQEVADTVVGQARLVAGFGQLAQAVVDDDRVAAPVNDAFVAEHAPAAEAGVGGGYFDFDVVGESLDLAPGAAIGIEHAQAEVGEVGHEDVVEVEQHRLLGRVDALDAQGQQNRVGVRGLDGLGGGRACFGLEVDVTADHLDLVADALEDDDAHAGAAGDGDGEQERLVELVGPDLGIEAVVLLVEVEEALVLLGPLDELVEVLELLFGRVGGRPLALRNRRADQQQRGKR